MKEGTGIQVTDVLHRIAYVGLFPVEDRADSIVDEDEIARAGVPLE